MAEVTPVGRPQFCLLARLLPRLPPRSALCAAWIPLVSVTGSSRIKLRGGNLENTAVCVGGQVWPANLKIQRVTPRAGVRVHGCVTATAIICNVCPIHRTETLCFPVNIDALPRLLSLLSSRSYCHLGQHGFSDLACVPDPQQISAYRCRRVSSTANKCTYYTSFCPA